MRRRALLVDLTGLILCSLITASAQGTAKQAPITGSVSLGQGQNPPLVGEIAGTFTLDRFEDQAGKLVAVGSLTGTLTPTSGAPVPILPQLLTLPVTLIAGVPPGKCESLHGVLGPLDENLVGLLLHINQAAFDISGKERPGPSLGRTICEAVRLIDRRARLADVVRGLNRLLAVFNPPPRR